MKLILSSATLVLFLISLNGGFLLKNLNLPVLFTKRNPKTTFDVDNFRRDGSIFFSFFDHLLIVCIITGQLCIKLLLTIALILTRNAICVIGKV